MKLRTILAIVPFLVVMPACGGGAPEPTDGIDVKVVATTSIVADLVRTVGGPQVEVEVLMGRQRRSFTAAFTSREK